MAMYGRLAAKKGKLHLRWKYMYIDETETSFFHLLVYLLFITTKIITKYCVIVFTFLSFSR
jgi:hypothetical protein